MEEWRHTDPSQIPFESALMVAKSAVLEDQHSVDTGLVTAIVDRLGERCGLVITSGSGVAVLQEPPAGLVVTVLDEDESAGATGTVVTPEWDLATGVNSMHFRGGVHVVADPGVCINTPIVIAHVVPTSATLALPRLLIEIGPGADVQVVEILLSQGDCAGSLVAPVGEILIGDGACCAHVQIQHLADDVFCVGSQGARLGQDARHTSVVANFGGRLGRLRNETEMVGEGAVCKAFGVYVGDGNRHVDFRTLQHHVAPHCVSRLLYRGAVWDQASAIYAGLVRIDRTAAQSDAHQASHYLVLSEDARVAAIPNLEIHNHDVSCGHAVSGGPPGEDEMYYLETRGISPDVARQLIVDGFFSDVTQHIPIAGAGRFVSEEVSARLARFRADSVAAGNGGSQ